MRKLVHHSIYALDSQGIDMANFAPNGTVDLISGINWYSDYADVRLFNNLTEQINWFTARPKATFTDCSYTRGSQQFVAVNANIETLWQYNYMRYQNENMGNKWFYAFIDRLEYRAPMTTYVYFTIDVFQTWQFDFIFLQCQIIREHVGVQNVGDKYFVDEGLSYGDEYETVYTAKMDAVTPNSALTLITSTIDLDASFGSYEDPNVVAENGAVVDSLASGAGYYLLGTPEGDTSVEDFFGVMKEYPWICNGIISLTNIPAYMASNLQLAQISLGETSYFAARVQGSTPPTPQLILDENVFQFFETVPNPKLLMYPYAVIEISCQNGSTLIIKPQYLNGNNLTIQRYNVLSYNPEVKYVIQGYRGDGDGLDFSLRIKDFPKLPILNTSYMLSESQAVHAENYSYISEMINTVLGAASENANPPADVTNIVRRSRENIYQVGQAYATSPTVSGQQGETGFNFAIGEMGLIIRWKQIAPKFREIIGNYLNMFGLKVNDVAVPNPNKMIRFDFLQTLDCKISANMPDDDARIIIDACNNGVRFWHDDGIGNYENNGGKS